MKKDPELGRLLGGELRRYQSTLEDASSTEAVLSRALHALKGSAGLAGEHGLSDAIARLERRLKLGDRSAVSDASSLVASAIEALDAGLPAVAESWPEPPPELAPSAIDPQLRARYLAEMRDRMARIDSALSSAGEPVEAVASAFRDVHAIKGAAAAVGDEVTTWFAHGLESRLRRATESEAAAHEAWLTLSRWRSVLGELPIDPAHGLEMLRVAARQRPSALPPVRRSTHPPSAPEEEPSSRVSGDETLRVPAAAIDRLIDRLARLGVLRDRIGTRVERERHASRELRQLRAGLVEALRLIGPPRPWGAPAAALSRIQLAANVAGRTAEEADLAGIELAATGETLHAEVSSTHAELAAMQRTTVRWLFERIARDVEVLARREGRAGREVRVSFAGGDAPIDRRLAEHLLDPLLQLAKNALAHGIEPAEARVLAGKPRAGTIMLLAEPRSDRLRLLVEDDGAGVDVAAVRERAIAAGTLSDEMARAVDDDTLLALLFVPGFTTKDSADLLAGRGLGLDLALSVVRRLGGTIRLTSRPGRGLSVTVDVPLESGLLGVLWVEAGGVEYALPAARARRVTTGAPGPLDARTVSLAAFLDAQPSAPTAFAIEIEPPATGWEGPLFLGVDRIGSIEEVALRPLSPVVVTAGPYAGAVVRGDGTLRLALDLQALATEVAGRSPAPEPAAPPTIRR